jgi:beta-phosphoglucomutase-like phosphatase (HAD superfamily)
MFDMAPHAGEAVTAKPAVESPCAVFFELEYVALPGRRAAFDALSRLLGESGVKLSPIQFSRYGAHPSPHQYLPGLLEAVGARKLSAAKAAEEVVRAMVEQLSAAGTAWRPGFEKIRKAVQHRNLALVALTMLPEASARQILEQRGLDADGVRLYPFYRETEMHIPRADTYLKIAKQLHKSVRRSLGLVSGATACRAAVATGVRCVVVPDEFTRHQDFGGAETVLDSLEDATADDLLSYIGASGPA